MNLVFYNENWKIGTGNGGPKLEIPLSQYLSSLKWTVKQELLNHLESLVLEDP